MIQKIYKKYFKGLFTLLHYDSVQYAILRGSPRQQFSGLIGIGNSPFSGLIGKGLSTNGMGGWPLLLKTCSNKNILSGSSDPSYA